MTTMVRAFLFGALFGVGLLLSGMTDPARVTDFLDWAGAWNPSLAFVLGGAVLTATPLFRIAARRGRPLIGRVLDVPAAQGLDIRLLLGAAIFGIGWGLAGICPGPSLVLLGLDPLAIVPFIAAMVVGLWLAKRRWTRSHRSSQPDHDRRSTVLHART